MTRLSSIGPDLPVIRDFGPQGSSGDSELADLDAVGDDTIIWAFAAGGPAPYRCRASTVWVRGFVMPPKLISIVRSPQHLVALINRRVSDVEDPGFETVRVPLDQVKQSLYASKGRLLESWQRLGEVIAANEQVLFDLSVVLLETVPDLFSESRADPLRAEWNAVSTPIRPTQAHPRAFRGTKAQPPKPGRLPRTDLRPYLCDARSVKAVLAPLSRFDVRPKLEQTGYSNCAIDALASEAPWKVPPTFVQEVWPRLPYGVAARDRTWGGAVCGIVGGGMGRRSRGLHKGSFYSTGSACWREVRVRVGQNLRKLAAGSARAVSGDTACYWRIRTAARCEYRRERSRDQFPGDRQSVSELAAVPPIANSIEPARSLSDGGLPSRGAVLP